MKRRSFLAGMLGAAIAPAIVRSESLMKIYVPKEDIITLNFRVGDHVNRWQGMRSPNRIINGDMVTLSFLAQQDDTWEKHVYHYSMDEIKDGMVSCKIRAKTLPLISSNFQLEMGPNCTLDINKPNKSLT